MAEMMRLQIVTPDEAFFDGEVSMVELNTAVGICFGRRGNRNLSEAYPDGCRGCAGCS